MGNHLTLWIPGLRPDKQSVLELNHLPAKHLPELPSLNRILSRADRIAASDIIDHDYILHQLDVDTNTVNQWPLAQWRLALEETTLGASSSQWVCADPVYIHPDRSDALLFAHEELDIELNEARQIAELVNKHYMDEPWELHAVSTHRWYIKLEQPYDFNTHVLHEVKGKNIFEYLPSGHDVRYWQQCMNELQMLLHGSEINPQREEKNQLPINSLWLWGNSKPDSGMPGHTPIHWQQIYSDNMVIGGLGVLSGSKVNSLPDELDEIENIEGDTLVILEQLQAALQQEDVFTWLEDLHYLEKYWFAPLLTKLRDWPDMDVTMLVTRDEAYRFNLKLLKRWWRFSNKNKLF